MSVMDGFLSLPPRAAGLYAPDSTIYAQWANGRTAMAESDERSGMVLAGVRARALDLPIQAR